jgi:putative holliday junction resolvase
MRVAALDYGKARIGVAVADELGMYAHPRPPLDGRNLKAALEGLRKLVRDEGIERFVVGLPVSLSGHEGPAAGQARGFAQKVADATGCEVELWDERLTSVEAHKALRASGVAGRDQRGKVDGVAAAIVLESWLAAQGPDRG